MPEAPVEGLLDASALRELDRDELLAALKPLFEDAGPLADALLGCDAKSWDEVLDAAARAIEAMDDETRAELLQAHPRIGERAEVLRARSAASFLEQGGAAGTPRAVSARLEELNEAYEVRFGFPFVEWVAGRDRAAIIPVLEARLVRDRSLELRAGTDALLAIARDRLARLRSGPPWP